MKTSTHINNHITTKLGRKVLSIKNFSIKSLTLLGFSLVATPLVIALLFGASQVNNLAKNSEGAIIDVATLLDNQQLLKSNQIKMERNASQYLVLRDTALKENYIKISQQILLITQRLIEVSTDETLQKLSREYTATVTKLVNVTIPTAEKKLNNDAAITHPIQNEFNKLTDIYEKITLRGNEINTQYINNIKRDAQDTRDVMIQSLVIIPISLCIAILFIFLITTPLKLLTHSILRLQKGKFDQKIQSTGSPEIQEIAQALENMRTRLHALELQKSSFIRHISHELKTPLAAIREGTELLYDNSVGQLNPEQQEISHIIKDSVFRLQQHIEDLLDFNIVLDSTSLQDSEKILIDDVINQVIFEQKLNIQRNNIELEITPNNIQLMSNRKQVAVIIDNLLSNAIKYSPDNGIIVITTTLIEDQLQLTVSDEGIGISDENHHKIFDAFYQGPPPENSALKGSGLGLTIVKELTLRLSGHVELHSNNQQQRGTKITITLPRASELKELG